MRLFVFIVLWWTASASDRLSIARCRSHCITRLNVWPSNDRKCSAEIDCTICWDHCRNLAEDWDKWHPLCLEPKVDFCPRHPGCRHACDIMRDMSPPSNSRAVRTRFNKPRIDFREVSRDLRISWSYPRRSSVLVSWVFFQEAGRPWQPLVQTLNSSIQLHLSGRPRSYTFGVLLVDRDGILIQSPVVSGTGKEVKGVDGPFSFPGRLPETGLAEERVEDRWNSLFADLQSINRRLSGNRTRVLVGPVPRTGLPLMLSLGLGGVGAVVLVLVGVLYYFQRFQSKQMAEMRASFHAWSGRLGSSFRSSFHVARQSFRRRSGRAYPNVPTIAESGEALKSDSSVWKNVP